MPDNKAVEIVSINLSDDIHITLYHDGTALLEFMSDEDDDIVYARLSTQEVVRLRAVLVESVATTGV